MPYAEPLTDGELIDGLGRLPDWTHEDGSIRRTITMQDFRAALALVNRVADAAEAANHHPDIEIAQYRRVTFRLTTHAAGGLTVRDLELAAEIDRVSVAVAAGR
jgi:4a-hydroxytetrahydrobiopterin dehydratase